MTWFLIGLGLGLGAGFYIRWAYAARSWTPWK